MPRKYLCIFCLKRRFKRQEGGELLYGALGLPGKMDSMNRRMNRSHENIGDDVNPYYHDFGEAPLKFRRLLTALYSSTKSSLVELFGSASSTSGAGGNVS